MRRDSAPPDEPPQPLQGAPATGPHPRARDLTRLLGRTAPIADLALLAVLVAAGVVVLAWSVLVHR